MRRLALVGTLGLALALAGCGGGGGGQGGGQGQERQTAGVHAAAQAALEVPGVVCAQGSLDTGGLPTPPVGALFVRLTLDPALTQEERVEAVREVAGLVWLSDLAVSRLTVVDDDGTADLGDALGTEVSAATDEDLEAAFGPQPPVPSPLPPFEDPGNPDC